MSSSITTRESLREIYTGPFFEWGIYHIFTDAAVNPEKLFPVSLYTANGDDWRLIKTVSLITAK